MFLGDVVGRAGRRAVTDHLPGLIADRNIDFVIVNGENAAGGSGITEKIFHELIDAGADIISTGNHIWGQREALVFIEREDRLLRPNNFPPGTPGRGANLVTARNGMQVLVINVMGRIFMDPMDDPFASVEKELTACPLGEAANAVVIDVHCEATSEKQAMGQLVDGRASLVVGTHTHVPTADYQILNGGTAYMTDAGMCGDYDSIIGMDKEEPMSRFIRKINTQRFEPADGEATLSGVSVDIDPATGLARRIGPVRIGGRLEPVLPAFWD
ncbi:MAG: TIGR00282 family metallophosphoesterase [Fimbriimonadaceae bacterium]|nr:TIGR00282 family metallophosphoesterase [Alphaproteobacteria bacterium]